MRQYLIGLDVLGMTPVTKPVVRPVTRPAAPRPASAPKPAATPPKPTATPPKPTTSAAKVKAAKTKAASSIKRAQTVAARLDKHRNKPVAARISSSLKNHVSALSTASTKIKGVVFGDDADTLNASSGDTDLLSQVGDIAAQVFDVIDPLYAAGKDDLAREGEAIVNAANYIVTTIEQWRRDHAAM